MCILVMVVVMAGMLGGFGVFGCVSDYEPVACPLLAELSTFCGCSNPNF
jgi:hypothetical protein